MRKFFCAYDGGVERVCGRATGLAYDDRAISPVQSAKKATAAIVHPRSATSAAFNQQHAYHDKIKNFCKALAVENQCNHPLAEKACVSLKLDSDLNPNLQKTSMTASLISRCEKRVT